MSLSLRVGRAALAEDMGMTLLPRTHSFMALCCWRCALSCALCDERGGDAMMPLFFPVLFLFDWVGVLWPQLSKVLKVVCWVGDSSR